MFFYFQNIPDKNVIILERGTLVCVAKYDSVSRTYKEFTYGFVGVDADNDTVVVFSDLHWKVSKDYNFFTKKDIGKVRNMLVHDAFNLMVSNYNFNNSDYVFSFMVNIKDLEEK